MIHLDRDRVEPPSFLRSDDWAAFVADYRSFHAQDGGARASQSSFSFEKRFEQFREPALRTMEELTLGKCAYSEQSGGGDLTIVWHRPRADARTAEQVFPEHYWWLATEWSNWLPATTQVAAAKGTQFPVVDESGRLEPNQLPSEGDEVGLLLDPFVDEPAWHLRFGDDGHVHSWARYLAIPRAVRIRLGLGHHRPLKSRRPADSRGDATIESLNLDRDELVKQRAAVHKSLRQTELRNMLQSPADDSGDERLLGDGREFAGLVRYEVALELFRRSADPDPEFNRFATSSRGASWATRLAPQLAAWGLYVPPGRYNGVGPLHAELRRPVLDYLEQTAPQLVDHFESRDRPASAAAESDSHRPRSTAMPSTEVAAEQAEGKTDESTPLVIPATARLTKIVIRNFKAVEHLELAIDPDFVPLPGSAADPGELEGQRWRCFLGENGSGKSCVLQAVGLGLAGQRIDGLVRAPDLPDSVSRPALKWKRLLRHGTKQGRIHLQFTTGAIDLRFNANRHWYVGGTPRVEMFVRGYGATRLLGELLDDDPSEPIRLSNLYDSREPVIDAERWLLDLAGADDDQGDFNVAAATLCRLLERIPVDRAPGDQADLPLRRSTDGKHIEIDGVPLEDSSDGYRAIIALTCDIMAGTGTGLSDMRSATGVVLIDEIGSHLHPRWRMTLTNKMRRAFPNMQFLVSTHEPLCLRGMHELEVVRVRNPHGHVELELIEKSPSDYRLDQLLTSEFFGMDTTIDPSVEAEFSKYYQLLALPESEKVRHADELHRLATVVKQHSVLGYTRRDQLVYEAIDEFLAERPTMVKRRDVDRAKSEAFQRVRDIWEWAEAKEAVERGTL